MYTTEKAKKEVPALTLLTECIKKNEGTKAFKLPTLYKSEVHYIRFLIENKFKIRMSLEEAYRMLVEENLVASDDISDNKFNLYHPNLDKHG